MIRAVDIDQAAELRASGSAYAVVEVDIRYRKPARLGDDLLVAKLESHRAPEMGDPITLGLPSDALHLFDAESGERLSAAA